MVRHFGSNVVDAYMRHVQDNAEEAVRRVIASVSSGSFAYEIDDGAEIRVRIEIDPPRGGGHRFHRHLAQLGRQFQRPLRNLYRGRALRLPHPDRRRHSVEGGCLKPLKIIIPPGSMLEPRYPAAVVAGNVETSQAITDALYGALGVLASAQGTMNNFTFGNGATNITRRLRRLGRGSGLRRDGRSPHAYDQYAADRSRGAGVAFPGAARKLRVRRGSGGPGKWRGGDGAVRRVRFLEPMTAAILSSHRKRAPMA